MGDLEEFLGELRGISIDTEKEYSIHITGFTVDEMIDLPNLMYKKVKITIEGID